MALSNVEGIIQSVEGPNQLRTKGRGRKVPFSLPDCRAETSVFSCPWTGTYTTSSHGSQAFRLLSWVSTLQTQLVHLLSLCNCVSPFLIMNLILYTFICMNVLYMYFLLALENPNMSSIVHCCLKRSTQSGIPNL